MFKILFGLLFGGLPLFGILPFFTAMLYPGATIDDFITAFAENWVVFAMSSVFIFIGGRCFIQGVKEVFANSATAQVGVETFGYVIDFYYCNQRIGGTPLYAASIVVLEPGGQFKIYNESVGDYRNAEEYINQYVKLKHYKKDVNLLNIVQESDCPREFVQYINDNYIQKSWEKDKAVEEFEIENDFKDDRTDEEEFIIIDGVKYIKIK